jgi:hypothetical protein
MAVTTLCVNKTEKFLAVDVRPGGATDYIDADFRDPDALLAGAARTLDFTQPVAVMLLGGPGPLR